MRNKHSGASLSIRAIAGNHVVALAWISRGTSSTHHPPARLRGRADGVRHPGSPERGGALLPAGHQALRGPGQGAPRRHPVPHFRAPDPVLPVVRLHREAVDRVHVPAGPDHGGAQGPDAARTTWRSRSTSRPSRFMAPSIRSSSTAGRLARRPTPGSSRIRSEDEDGRPDLAAERVAVARLYEALVEFIGRAKDSTFALRAALYEFHFDPIGAAFQGRAGSQGRREDPLRRPKLRHPNRTMINHVGLSKVCAPRKSGGAQKHNKFIVLLKNGKPIEGLDGLHQHLERRDLRSLQRGPQRAQRPGGRAVSSPTGTRSATRSSRRPAAPSRSATRAPIPARAAWSPGTTRPTRPRPGIPRTAFDHHALQSTRRGHTPVGTRTGWRRPTRSSASWSPSPLAEPFEPFLEADSNVLRFVLSDKQLKQGPLSRRTGTWSTRPARSSRRASCPTSSPRSSPAGTRTSPTPRQVHAHRSPGRRSHHRHRIGQLQPVVPDQQRRETC